MRYTRTLPLFLLLLALSARGQGLVSHEPRNCTVLVEQFTGVQNNNAPAANIIGEQLELIWPDEVAIVRLHATSFAVPIGDDEDLRTTWGNELSVLYGVAFLPAAMVDRRPINNSILLTTGAIGSACEEALALPAPVNMGMATTYDQQTRELIIQVELYYTAADTGGNDRLSVLLKEDHVMAAQLDAMSSPQLISEFDHRHVLRSYITELEGDEVLDAETGTTVIRNYSYTIPEAFDAAQCAVVAFVGEQFGIIYQARELPATGGSTVSVPNLARAAVDLNVLVDGSGTIQLDLGVPLAEPSTLVVLNAAGQLLQEARLPVGVQRFALDRGATVAGVYICQLHNANWNVSRRFVVRH